MAATVSVEQVTGTAGSRTYTTKSTALNQVTRYYTTDSFAPSSANYPIPIPTAADGLSGSYWVTHCLNCTATGGMSYIKDVKWYITIAGATIGADWSLTGGGAKGHRGDLVIGVSSSTLAKMRASSSQGISSSAYVQATGTQGSFGYFISSDTNGHTYYKACAGSGGGMVSTKHFNSLANALMVQSGNALVGTTGRTHFIVTQVLVASGATQGDKTDKTATFVYSEI